MTSSQPDLPEPKKDNQKLVRIISGIAGVAFIIALIIIRAKVPSFSLKALLFSIGGVVAFFAAVIIAYYFMDKRSGQKALDAAKAEKIPPAVTIEQAREIALKVTQNPAYADYINGCLGERIEELGKGIKSRIYTYMGKGKYEKDLYYVVLNMHYPLEKMTILINPTPTEWEIAKQRLANFPEDVPEVKETVLENPILGTRQTIREVIKKEEDKKAEAKKEDDL